MSEENVNTDDTGGKENKDQTNENVSADEKNENMIPKSRLDQVLAQKAEALAELKAVADLMIEDVPEDFKDIIPDLPPKALIGWLRGATKKGIFNQKIENGLDTKRPAGKAPVDLSKMNPEQMMSQGYK